MIWNKTLIRNRTIENPNNINYSLIAIVSFVIETTLCFDSNNFAIVAKTTDRKRPVISVDIAYQIAITSIYLKLYINNN